MRLHFVDQQTTFHVTYSLKMQIDEKLILLRPPLVKMLLSSFSSAYVSMWRMYFYIHFEYEYNSNTNLNTNSILLHHLNFKRKKISFCIVFALAQESFIIHQVFYILFTLTTFLVPIILLFNSDNYCVYWCHSPQTQDVN